jgi:hypothetical protein
MWRSRSGEIWRRSSGARLVKKSHATMLAACARKNSRQLGPPRRGAGPSFAWASSRRQQCRCRRRRPQAARDRLAPAQPRGGVRLHTALARPRGDPPTRAPDRHRPGSPHARRDPPLRQPPAARPRAGARPPGRVRLRPPSQGLAAGDQERCGCRTGAAHLQVSRSDKQLGRSKPHLVRFRSRITRTTPTLTKEPPIGKRS